MRVAQGGAGRRRVSGAAATWLGAGPSPASHYFGEAAPRHNAQGPVRARLHGDVGRDQACQRRLSDRRDRVLPLGLRHRAAHRLARLARRPRQLGADLERRRASLARHHLELRHVRGLRRPRLPAALGRRRDRLRLAAHGRRPGGADPQREGQGLPLERGGDRLCRRADHADAAPLRRRARRGARRRTRRRGDVRAPWRGVLRRRDDPGPPPARDRAHRRHRALLLADDDRPRPRDDRARLARADRGRVRAPRRDRHPRRHRPDPAHAELPLRRRLARRAVRIHDHDLGLPPRLVLLRPGAAAGGGDRRGDRRRGRAVRSLARAPARPCPGKGRRDPLAAPGVTRPLAKPARLQSKPAAYNCASSPWGAAGRAERLLANPPNLNRVMPAEESEMTAEAALTQDAAPAESSRRDWPALTAELLSRLRREGTRVHAITNAAAQVLTANLILAAGGTPSLTIAPEEITAFTSRADALVVNLGTLDGDRRAAIPWGIAAAKAQGKPWVLDPVFVDASPPRLELARLCLAGTPCVLRCNRAEFAALAGEAAAPDSLTRYAAAIGCTVALTGATDWVADGERFVAIANGHPLMA